MEDAKYQQHVQHLQGGVVGDGNNTTIHYHGTAGSPSVPHTPVPTSAWNVPFQRNPFFIGRDELLKQLHNRLTTGTATALTQAHAINGLGGIGKTQIAVEYAYRYRKEYPFVLWARAENRETLITDLVALADLLKVEGYHNPDQNKVVAALKHWLTTHLVWLLIFDNADEPHLLSDVLPPPGTGHILLTSRATYTQPIAKPLEVEQMEEGLGALFLLQRARLLHPDVTFENASASDQRHARQLSQTMGGLPLALDQAGAYIDETQCTLEDYLHYYYQDQMTRRTLLHKRGKFATGHPEPVATTWSLSFSNVEQANPAAADLLRACAFLAPDVIPEDLLRAEAQEGGEMLQAIAKNSFLWNEAIGELLKYSLVRRNREHKTLSIHRLVQAVLKDAMDEPTILQWVERTVHVVDQAFPLDVNVTTWVSCAHLLPHAQVCLILVEQYEFDSLKAAHLFNQAASYLDAHGRYTEAEPLYQRALTIREKVLGPDHPDTALSLNNLGALYNNQGKYDLAKPLYQRALTIREKVLGPDHPGTALSLNNLGLLYNNQDKYDLAEPLYQRALTIREKVLGPDHPGTAFSLNDLGVLYDNQGKYDLAEPLLQRALAIREKVLGPEHPDTAFSLNDLGVLYDNQGKYDLAEPLYQRALAIREKVLGPEHPDTATSLNNLGVLYNHQGKYDLAEPLYQRALAIYEKVFGPEHPYTAIALGNYAKLLRKMQRTKEAEELEERAAAIRAKQ